MGSSVPNVPVDQFVQALDDETKRLIIQSIAVNSTAFEGLQDGKSTFIGSKTEVALLLFSQERLAAKPVQEERENANVVQQVPLIPPPSLWRLSSSSRAGDLGYMSKAPRRSFLEKCTRVIGVPDGSEASDASTELSATDMELFKRTIASYADQTLRTIGTTIS